MANKARSNRRTEHRFSQIPQATISRSMFNRSHSHKTTFNSGVLVPIYVDEVLPGDTVNLNMTAFARMATPIWPVMDNARLNFFFFFCPYRLVWTNWPKFCGEQDDPDASTDYTVPQLVGHSSSGFLVDSVPEYMGVPATLASLSVSALPTRSYNLIWNQWFRDENLQDPVVVDKDDGPDSEGNYRNLLRRGKRHDYFTSCLPFPSKGPGVEIPLGETAAVVRNDATSQIGVELADSSQQRQGTLDGKLYTGAGPSDVEVNLTGASGGHAAQDMYWGEDVGLQVDLSTATAATINTLRQAFQIQKLFERDARGGTRYTEIVKSHFQVSSPDQRLQRVEYLGGGSAPLIISAVPQTTQRTDAAGWDNNNYPGDLGGFGTVQSSGIGFKKSFTEHGTIIGLVSAQADLTYQQGLHRMWSRSTRYDFYWPAFQSLGEQAVLNQEIYCQAPSVGGADPENLRVFGYQERWAEYRYFPSRISGLFNTARAANLGSWHLAQHFDGLPTLGNTFISDDPPFDRVVAVTSPVGPQFIFDSYFDIKCARPMPVYSVPGLIDHF